MQQPVEVHVEEHEPIVERVAAIDVAKASGMVCLRIPHETPGPAGHQGVAGAVDHRRPGRTR
jgi:hypothetical protein